MDLKITSFFMSAAPMDYSASMAEIGQNAGADTWAAACEDSPDHMILTNEEERESFRAFVRSSGGWTDEEVRQWSDVELNALLLQWISGDMREPVGFELGARTTAEQWAEYEQQSRDGLVSGRLFKGADGEIYFSIWE